MLRSSKDWADDLHRPPFLRLFGSLLQQLLTLTPCYLLRILPAAPRFLFPSTTQHNYIYLQGHSAEKMQTTCRKIHPLSVATVTAVAFASNSQVLTSVK